LLAVAERHRLNPYGALRCSTIADALAGHVVICDKVKSGEIGA
jgi:hypothetical protein